MVTLTLRAGLEVAEGKATRDQGLGEEGTCLPGGTATASSELRSVATELPLPASRTVAQSASCERQLLAI
jgi:hypothetical protein